MRELDSAEITLCIQGLIEKALKQVEEKTIALIETQAACESNALAKWALDQIVDNNRIALATDSYPCQDTGIAVIFAEVGNQVLIKGKLLDEAVNEGVRLAYRAARKSIADPLTRQNTQDNTPAVLHTRFVEGARVKLTFLSKGAGSENMGGVFMLTPSQGREGIVRCVTDCVKRAGANPCPPIVVGVGIGGSMEQAALLSKYALTRETKQPHAEPDIAALEQEILQAINALSIGAQGFGGGSTCLGVMAETFPTHIGMLPVAVNIQCHSVRHATAIL